MKCLVQFVHIYCPCHVCGGGGNESGGGSASYSINLSCGSTYRVHVTFNFHHFIHLNEKKKKIKRNQLIVMRVIRLSIALIPVVSALVSGYK